MADGDDPYGGKPLRKGEKNDMVPLLRTHLVTLGFPLAKASSASGDDEFDDLLEEAVREFQCTAKLAKVAKEAATPAEPLRYLERLTTVDVAETDRFPIATNDKPESLASGDVTPQTRKIIKSWWDNQLRNPLVIAGWNVPAAAKPKKGKGKKAKPPSPAPTAKVCAFDLSLPSRKQDKSLEIYLHDFSGIYFPTVDPRTADRQFYIGTYMAYAPHHKKITIDWGGPSGMSRSNLSKGGHVSVSPDTLTGGPIVDPNSATASTYRVIAAIARVESFGTFDIVNGYDAAVLSAGLFHYTIIAGREFNRASIGIGELTGSLSRFEALEKSEFARLFGTFGLRAEREWKTDGKDLFVRGTKTWNGFPARESSTSLRGAVLKTRNAVEVLRTWQWVARFAMASRASGPFRQLNWHFGRMRLKQLMETPIGGTFPKQWTIGSVFSCEQTIAKILRAHVNLPATVLRSVAGKVVASKNIINSLQAAKLTATEIATDPAQWKQTTHEKISAGLNVGIARYAKRKGKGGKYDSDFETIEKWKLGNQKLSLTSFKLDQAGI